MSLTDNTSSSITEALERAVALHAEVLRQVRALLDREEPVPHTATLDARPSGR
jgi:hypothetical protein